MRRIILILIIEEQDNHHYVLNRDLTKLIGCQYNNRTEKKHICNHCLRGFKKEETLKSHITKGCLAIEGLQIKMPPEDDNIQFKNHVRQFKAPFALYADFECLTMDYSSKMSKPIDVSKYYTECYQHHKPCGYKMESYQLRGSDCMNHFVKTCRTITLQIMNKLQINVHIKMISEDEYGFQNATHCSICENPCDPDDKVRDHCHMTGKYTGCAHSSCNSHVSFKDFKITVFVHNLKGYD